MAAAVIVAGFLAETLGWWIVSSGRADVWRLMPVVLAGMAAATLLVGIPTGASDVGEAAALGAGLLLGVGLYVVTRAFVAVAVWWRPFRREVVRAYEQARRVSEARALVLSLIVMVPSEELFWRGLVQPELSQSLGTVLVGVAGGLSLYVVANLTSRSPPIIAGAVVGGALWSALAWWSGGVIAPLASHILWTGLMLALPPGAGREVSE
jgi:hypothetical protein